MFHRSLKPYFSMLGKWLYYGILEDLHSEFFVEETFSQSWGDSVNVKFEENYWDDKYIFSDKKVPAFLQQIGYKIFLTGKYVNVIKVYDPKRELQKTLNLLDNYTYTLYSDELKECVEKAFDWANRQLVSIVMDEAKLIPRLQSIKRFYFMEQGDYFLHFMDLAEEELRKNVKNISLEKLQNFLDLSIRIASTNSDPYKEDLSCNLTVYSTLEVLQAFQHYNTLKDNKKIEFENQLSYANLYGNKKGFECFNLDYSVKWPLNLVLSKSTLLRYQILFRYLFVLRYSERQLYATWQTFQEQRDLNNNRFFRLASSLLQRMLHLSKTIIYHFLIEVVQRRWDELIHKLTHSVDTFEDILAHHDAFLQGCFREALLFEKKFKSLIWNQNAFFNFYCDNMRDFLVNYLNYDYKSLIVS